MKKKQVVVLKEITKVYELHHEKPTFVENVIRRGNKETFIALDNINLEIMKGERVGIIGNNGAGKTTLLKVIVGITSPTKGIVDIKGRVVSLIGLEAGFHPELTGEENIFLNGLVIGMSKQEIKSRFRQIVEFADIGQFIDTPLFTYSGGMKMRLGFSVAVHAKPDILILDEGMSVGDEKFRAKSSRKITQLFKQDKTIVVVSHSLDILKRNCERIIWMEKGKIIDDGGLSVISKYAKFN